MVIRISSIMKILYCEIESLEWSWIWNVQYTSYSVLEVLIAFMNCIAFVKKLGNSASGWLQSDGKFDMKSALWKQTVQQIFSNTKRTLHSLGDKFLNFDLEHKQTGTRFLPREVIHLNSYSARVTLKLLSD